MRVGIAKKMRHHLAFEDGRLARGPNGGTFARRREVVEIDAAGVDWVCAAVRPGREFMVADDLAEIGFRVFCPHGVRVSRWFRDRERGKRVYGERDYPVFAGYVFVGQPAGLLVTKRSHPHLLSVLDEGRSFAPAAFIGAAAALWAKGAWDQRAKVGAKLRCGQNVQVLGGPFAGFAGIVEKLPKEMRAVVSLSLFGRRTLAQIDTAELALV